MELCLSELFGLSDSSGHPRQYSSRSIIGLTGQGWRQRLPRAGALLRCSHVQAVTLRFERVCTVACLMAKIYPRPLFHPLSQITATITEPGQVISLIIHAAIPASRASYCYPPFCPSVLTGGFTPKFNVSIRSAECRGCNSDIVNEETRSYSRA